MEKNVWMKETPIKTVVSRLMYKAGGDGQSDGS